MAIRFDKTDDLDKMFEEFASLPELDKIDFPESEDKDKKAQAK